MTKKSGEATFFSHILVTAIFFILVLVLVYAVYLLYTNIPGEQQRLNVSLQNKSTVTKPLSAAPVKQFYPNMKFNHKDISYTIESSCTEKQKQRIQKAFVELQAHVPHIYFIETSQKPDIDVICSSITKEAITEDYFIAGEGGAKEIVQSGEYNIINDGIIYVYDKQKNSKECDYPNIEMHELLHVFGFDHTEDKNSIMYPFLESCDQVLDDSIIKELNEIYTMQDLADLSFEDIAVVKKGRYLDVNMTVKNIGTIPAEDTNIHFITDDEIVQVYPIEELSFGTGITISITNLRIKLSSDTIELVLDKENKIKEIDKKNNKAIITLN